MFGPDRFRLLFVVCLVGGAPAAAADWPQWRGQGRDGAWLEKGLPERFAAPSLPPRWQQPLGGGYGGIAVSGGKVFVMDRQTQPREVERVLCLNAATGGKLWTYEYPVRYGKLEFGNGPRSTPTVADNRVYTNGTFGHLFCLDAASGQVLWSRDTVKDCKARLPMWGMACSPLLDGERVVVQVGAPDGCLMAFDRRTGKVIWRSIGDPPGYSSPTLLEGQGWRLLTYFTPRHIVGVDPITGKERWKVSFEGISYDVSISDVVHADGILLASNYWSGSKAIRLDKKGEHPQTLWEGKQLSLLMSTPLVRDGHVYALDRFRGLKCLEMRTGQVKWEGEHVTPRGSNPHATLVWVGQRALIFNERGELLLARLTPARYQQFGKTQVWKSDQPIWAHPGFGNGCTFVRTDQEIVCVPFVP
jgi:outer membrane protein assembly factor BamB